MATATTSLALIREGDQYTRLSSLLHSIFMSTVSTFSNTLLQVASSPREGQKWRASDHLRYLLTLSIRLTVWVLTVLIDHFPSFVVPSPPALLDGLVCRASSLSSSSSSSSSSLVLHRGFGSGTEGPPSTKAIGRALSHIFALVNEIPVTSRKYQFAVAMAERIVEENSQDGHEALHNVNRTALSGAFHHTTALLYNSLHGMHAHQGHCHEGGSFVAWPSRFLRALPLGSHLVSYLRTIGFCLGSIFSLSTADEWGLQKQLMERGEEDGVFAEKLAQELMWIMNKMRFCSVVEEAIEQWSLASGLASLSVTAAPRIQGPILKITAILFREMAQGEYEAPRQVKYRMLMLWMPLLCYASHGVAFPVLTGYERTEVERVMEELIFSLPAPDQEVILNNWLQDYTVSSSDWPNLQRCYDRWCRSSRKLIF